MSVERSVPGGAVFLSYASQDVAAARRIADALRAATVEVWMDESELVGGDAWDQKIRGQIKACALFVPVISANTQARREGYFRLEWKLAAQRTHTIADGTPFLLPVVIDSTRDADTLVPEEFRSVQWTRLRDGEASAAFCTRVKSLLGGSAVGRVSDPPSESSSRERAGQRPTLPRKSHAPIWISAMVVVVALVVALALWRPWTTTPSGAPTATAPTPTSPLPSSAQNSVAVLAFDNTNPDKDTEYFSDGISEEILNALANNSALRVAGRTSSFSFKGKSATSAEIGRALNVARIIEGSVRKSGNKVRISVRLINAADGYQLWSEPFERDMTDIFAVQSEIAAKVAQKLSGNSPASVTAVAASTAAPTKNLEAYDLYLRALALMRRVYSPDSAYEAIGLLEAAVGLDPDFAPAWARISHLYSRIRGGFDGSEQTAISARKAADTALRLAPNLSEAHLAMAMVHLSGVYDLGAAQRELEEADRTRSNNPEVYAMRVRLEHARGNWGEEFFRLIVKTGELDPQNADMLATHGSYLAQTGRFAEAERTLSRSWALSQTSHTPIRSRATNHVAWTGDMKGALEILETVPERLRENGSLVLIHRAHLHADMGNVAAAIADFEKVSLLVTSGRFTTSGPRISHVQSLRTRASLEARRGNPGRATELYSEALTAARQYLKDFPHLTVVPSELAFIHAGRGEKNEALNAIDDALNMSAKRPTASTLASLRGTKAELLTVLGQHDDAIAELRAVHEMGYGFGYRLRRGLEWEPLRGDAKFQQLMKEAEARADAQPRPKK
jgi:TolB-like protein/tetratricopeptide (TPR) repeat protein